MLIAICDDVPQEQEAFQACLLQAAAELSADVSIRSYPSGETLIQAVRDGARPDLAILDIYMDGMNGIATARALRQMLPDLFLAFLTTSKDFAVDAFELNALHYVVKPVAADSARVLLLRLFEHTEKPVRVLELSAGRGEICRFPLPKITRVTSRDRGVEIHLRGERGVWLPRPFREAAEQLDGEPDFLHLSRGYIVNMNDIRCLDYDICCLKDGARVPISRRERVMVRNRYNDFLFCRMDRTREGMP